MKNSAHKSMQVWARMQVKSSSLHCAVCTAWGTRSGKNWKSLKNRHKKWINTNCTSFASFFHPENGLVGHKRSRLECNEAARCTIQNGVDWKALSARHPTSWCTGQQLTSFRFSRSLLQVKQDELFLSCTLKTHNRMYLCTELNEWRNMISISTEKELFLLLIHLLLAWLSQSSNIITWQCRWKKAYITYTTPQHIQADVKTLSMHRTHSRVLFS